MQGGVCRDGAGRQVDEGRLVGRQLGAAGGDVEDDLHGNPPGFSGYGVRPRNRAMPRWASSVSICTMNACFSASSPAAMRPLCASGRSSARVAATAPGCFASSASVQPAIVARSEEHTSELQSLMRISYAVFCLKKKNKNRHV